VVVKRLVIVGALFASGCLSNQMFWCADRRHLLNRFGSDLRIAQAILRNADAVESPSLGPAGAPSCLVAAYRVVLSDKGAREHFEKLSREATVAGRLYAFAGLYEVDPDHAKTIADGLRDLTGPPIELRDGCLATRVTPAEIVAKLQADDLRAAWRRRP